MEHGDLEIDRVTLFSAASLVPPFHSLSLEKLIFTHELSICDS